MENNNSVIWKLDHTDQKLSEKIRESLRKVFDPELGLNIIQLGLVRDVEIEDDTVAVTMILTTPFCPYAPALMDKTRQNVEEISKLPTKVELGFYQWDPSMMEDDVAADWGLYL